MATAPHEDLVDDLARALHANADPAQAARMAAYLKTDAPQLGVTKPALDVIVRDIKTRHPPADHAGYVRAVEAIWQLPWRDGRSAAIRYARAFPKYVVHESLPLYERMIREGAWWDLVDEIAAWLVGRLWSRDAARTRAALEPWVADSSLWIRRAAIISQLRKQFARDADFLFAACLRCADERDFFMRKAIGWALRECARRDPAAVRAFLDLHGAKLSPLSRKEAERAFAPASEG